jgi:hypothetical protein
MKAIKFISLLLVFPCIMYGQEIVKLYPGAIPNATKNKIQENNGLPANSMFNRVTTPTLEVYLPEKEKATGAAVIICPGGGYSVIVYQGEGIGTAKEFAKNGVTAFVLKYRLPDDSILVDKTIGPLQDLQQAIKVVRENAAKWGVNPFLQAATSHQQVLLILPSLISKTATELVYALISKFSSILLSACETV